MAAKLSLPRKKVKATKQTITLAFVFVSQKSAN